MRKLSLALALIAGCMMPLSAVAQDASSSKSKSKKRKSKKSKKSKSTNSSSTGWDKTIDSNTVVGGKLSSEQLMLNHQAVTAVKNNEFKKAEQLYQALLQLGEFNYIWYQLGRTYARQDKCVEAYDAFSHVASAPILDPEEFPPERVRDATQKGLADLDAQCSARVVFSCHPEQMVISLDGGVEFECSTQPVALVPGRHSVYAKTSFGFNTLIIDAIEGQVTMANVDVINFEEVATNAGVTPEELERRTKLFNALGYSFIGVGTAIAVGGGVWMWWMDHTNYLHTNPQAFEDVEDDQENDIDNSNEIIDEKKRFEKLLPVTYAMITVGAVMAVTGVALVIYDAVKIKPQIEELDRSRSLYFSPVISPSFSGFALTGTF